MAFTKVIIAIYKDIYFLTNRHMYTTEANLFIYVYSTHLNDLVTHKLISHVAVFFMCEIVKFLFS